MLFLVTRGQGNGKSRIFTKQGKYLYPTVFSGEIMPSSARPCCCHDGAGTGYHFEYCHGVRDNHRESARPDGLLQDRFLEEKLGHQLRRAFIARPAHPVSCATNKPPPGPVRRRLRSCRQGWGHPNGLIFQAQPDFPRPWRHNRRNHFL